MESQLQRTHESHGHHYDEHDILTADQHTGHDHNEHGQHGEKKSVMKKVKEKAKKLKDTIAKHGHGHSGHDHHDEHHQETVEDPEVHGEPILLDLGSPSVMSEDRYTKPLPSTVTLPPVSTGAYGTKLTGVGETYGGQDANIEKWRGKIGQPVGMKEDPNAPNPTRVQSPVLTVTHDPTTYDTKQVFDLIGDRGDDVNQGGLKGVMEKSTGMVPDPNAPIHQYRVGSDPVNYEAKVIDPTHTGGKHANLSQIRRSLDKLSIHNDPNHPKHLPHGTFTKKISSSASVIAEKAAVAKKVIAHKLASHQTLHHSPAGSHRNVHHSSVSKAKDYAHNITDKVTETLAPVYEKVVDAGSSVIHKVHDTVAGTGAHYQHGHRGVEHMKVDNDKGVTHVVVTLKPGEEDKELSDVITHDLHGQKQDEMENKSREDKPMGTSYVADEGVE